MDYPLLNIFVTTMWVFLWVLWLFLLFRVFADLFRDDDVGGWGKAGWSVFLIVLPFLGVFVYLVARGRGMGIREGRRAAQAQQEMDAHIREVTGATGRPASSGVEDLVRLADLRNHGDITEEEYQRAKDKVLAA